MKTVLIAIMRFFLQIIYFFIKLFTPQRDTIAYISRQSDKPGIDFAMLSEEISRRYPGYRQIMLCRTMPKSAGGMLKYALHILTQMRAIAAAKVVLLDTYCIPISLLSHRKTLKVVQMWHALGAFKKFGLSIAGQPEGSSLEIVKAMRMHKGYTYALCSGDCCAEPFAEAFGLDPSQMLPVGLPRMDYLAEEKYVGASRSAVLAAYPFLENGKKTILYVPTFRRANGVNDYTMEEAAARVRESCDLSLFNLIIKTHSGSELVLTSEREEEGFRFMGMDLISVANYIISDYSSIVFEAALTLKPVYLYCYDRDQYVTDRGFYLDYDEDIPAVRSEDIGHIMYCIGQDIQPPREAIEQFAEKYVSRHGSVTALLADLVDELARDVYDGRYNYKAK